MAPSMSLPGSDSAPTPDPIQGKQPRGSPADIARERDLYWSLLELGARDELEPFLEEALSLILPVTGARQGYLELHDDATSDGEPRFWMAHGCYDQEVEQIRATFSRGVIAEALASGRTIVTASALQDPRFIDRGSVQRNRIEAVLCAPIGAGPPIGVVYLQGRISGAFAEEDRLRVEAFARHIAPFADRLLMRRRRRDEADPTVSFRKALRAEGLIGRSAALAKVLQQVAAAAQLDITVLLTGPSGTGKTQIARILHHSGPRSNRPFLELNCAALPESLLEQELFGALPGAHSTVLRKIDGKVAAAEGGTLFLDEIGELKPAAQAKLLQLMQSKEYFPLGSNRPVRANIRIIAATNVDLKVAIAQKEFRQDLLYRLQVLTIRMPSLAERREDIAALTEHFCELACNTHGLPRMRMSAGALRAVEAAEWSGNVREIFHAVESAAARAAGEKLLQIERRHLFPEAAELEATTKPAGLDAAGLTGLTFQEATRRFQAELLQAKLEETGWNVTEAAEQLDLSRSHAYTLISAFGLGRQRPESNRPRYEPKEA